MYLANYHRQYNLFLHCEESSFYISFSNMNNFVEFNKKKKNLSKNSNKIEKITLLPA